MNTIKSLALGSAAALVAMTGAQAADLPLKAKAVEYVKVCSLYGAGFYYIPGTDTCIKLGGYLRVDMGVNTNSVYTGNTSGPGGANNRFTSGYTWRSREDLTLDTRTATEYGVVRTFFDATFTWTGDNYAGNGVTPGTTIYSPLGGGSTIAAGSSPNNASSGAVAGGTLGVYYAFIQFAGFTIGKAVSQFSAPFVNYPGNNYDGLVGGGGTVTGVNQFTYTAQFGNGVSASLGAQDSVAYYQAGLNNLGTGVAGFGAFGASDYANSIMPDFVATLSLDQAWGTIKASGAIHSNHAAYYGAFETTGHPDDKIGYAGQIAFALKNLPTGPGDTLNFQGVYTNGATRYNIQDLAAQAGATTIFSGSGLGGTYQSVGFGTAPDAVFGTNGTLQLVETYGGRGGFTHNWSPFWNSSIYGAYAAIRYTGEAKNLICGAGGVRGTFRSSFGAGTNVTECNPDYNIAQAGVVTRWTPVKNLTFSGEFVYTHLDQKMAGVVGFAGSAAIGKPAAVYELRDQNTYQVLLRAQRNF